MKYTLEEKLNIWKKNLGLQPYYPECTGEFSVLAL